MYQSKEPLLKTMYHFLERSGYELSRTDLRFQLEGSPSFPAVKSISDALDYFKIEHVVAEVPVQSLKELPKTFLATIESDNEMALIDVTKGLTTVKIRDGQSRVRTETYDAFIQHWTGMVVVVEPGHIQTTEISHGFRKAIMKSLISVPIFLLMLIRFEFWYEWVLVVFGGLGFCASMLSVREELGLFTVVNNKICGTSSVITSCQEIINSASAKIFHVKLSDLALSFFGSFLLWVLFLGSNLTYFAMVTSLSTPIIIYSIYIQGWVQKKWCPLCLGIAGVVLTLAGTALFLLDDDLGILHETLIYAVQASSVGFLVFWGWYLLKPMIVKAIEGTDEKLRFARFRRNPAIVLPALKSQPFRPMIDLKINEQITFGDSDGTIDLIGITNPFCQYCGTSFQAYLRLLDQYGDQLRLQLIFNVNPDANQNDQLSLTLRIFELYQMSKDVALHAIADWYVSKNIDQWLLRYGNPENSEKLELIRSHYNWCAVNQFHYTPATVIDGHIFPKEFQVEDLIHFIPEFLSAPNKHTDSITINS